MSHVLLRLTATPNVGSAPLFSTAAVLSVAPATRHHRLATPLIAAISRIHIALPEPRQHYSRRRDYFEAAQMSREMEHL
jgi:hypothetical protein